MLETLLKKITKETKNLHGTELLEKFCNLFNTMFDAEHTYIIEVSKNLISGITLSNSHKNPKLSKDLFVYSLKGKPCELVLNKKKTIVYNGNLKNEFPKINFSKIEDINSYIGIPIINKKNECHSILISVFKKNEIPNYTKLIMETFASRISTIIDLIHQENIIEEQYYFDPLTSLPNRAAFSESLKNIKKSKTYNSAIFLDVDYFKTMNESLGHHIGDLILKKVSIELKEFLKCDCEVFRMGSDEFAVLFFNEDEIKENSTKKAEAFAAKLIEHFNKPMRIDFHELIINFSVGVYTFNHHDSVHDVIRYADISLSQAKLSGHNTILRYTNDMQENGQKKLLLKSNLVKAINENELDIHPQPQFDNNGDIYGAESLIRWKKDGSFISPLDFIPLAEETGLIKLIGNQVLSKTCEFFEQNMDRLPDTFKKFSINVSPIEFYQPNFVEDFINTFENYNIPATRMEIEITENVFFKERHESIKKMYQLLDYGFSFAVDDFGTGYSSLSYLIDLPFNKLKIDRAFIQRMSESIKYRKLVESIINICNHMNFDVIAEGIENLEDFEFLKDIGCKYYQGFYFSKPLTRDDFCNKQLKKRDLQ
jgi:diguanylate cyclase (GGDEF)-like protein